jgi:hypothetical protein
VALPRDLQGGASFVQVALLGIGGAAVLMSLLMGEGLHLLASFGIVPKLPTYGDARRITGWRADLGRWLWHRTGIVAQDAARALRWNERAWRQGFSVAARISPLVIVASLALLTYRFTSG